jgi:hypothetical protein
MPILVIMLAQGASEKPPCSIGPYNVCNHPSYQRLSSSLAFAYNMLPYHEVPVKPNL